MKRIVVLSSILMVLAGCAVVEPGPSAQAGGQLFRGEVWTWDEQTNVVTLRTGAENVRVRVTPEQIRGLRLHEVATVRGALAPPGEIPVVVSAPGATRPVPRGAPQQSEVTGAVTSTDPKGLVVVGTQHGPLTVWSATTDAGAFPAGTPVRLRTTVQPVDMVASTLAPAAVPGLQPAASVPTEPGDHAVVTGRILAVDSAGTITVESPRGPITVAVPDVSMHRAGSFAQVRTTLQRAQ